MILVVPNSYRAVARQHAEFHHQIPFEDSNFPFNEDFNLIAEKVCQLLNRTKIRDGIYPLVFCLADQYTQTHNGLTYLRKHAKCKLQLQYSVHCIVCTYSTTINCIIMYKSKRKDTRYAKLQLRLTCTSYIDAVVQKEPKSGKIVKNEIVLIKVFYNIILKINGLGFFLHHNVDVLQHFVCFICVLYCTVCTLTSCTDLCTVCTVLYVLFALRAVERYCTVVYTYHTVGVGGGNGQERTWSFPYPSPPSGGGVSRNLGNLY